MLKSTESGSVLIYVLVAVAVLAAVTITLMGNATQSQSSQSTTNLVSDIKSQIDYIRSGIQECVFMHPAQAADLTSTEQKNQPFPISPMDSYFTGASPVGVATSSAVVNIRCPGDPGPDVPTPLQKNHALIFSSAARKILPRAPNLMNDWLYYNGADGVYISIQTSKTDPFIATAFKRLDAQFSTCEVDYFETAGSAANMTSDTPRGEAGVRTCPANSRCFRYWLILNTATSVHGDGAGC